uniref:Pseudouridine synthase RsuA/RluA-like domain-containing protein n=1 Tax=Kalanchoe fedtschenkoi TaxID=63787 RepID=A0A7N0ZUQ1_KALFE
MTLIDYYSRKHKNSTSLQGWLQRIENGQISVNGSVFKNPKGTVRAKSELVYHRLPWKERDAPHLLHLLYEDDDMIALSKPSGLQVLPGGLFQQRIVLTQLQWREACKPNCSSNQEMAQPVPVHRLGRGTSGVLLCAKTKLAKIHLGAYFADGTAVVKNSNSACARRKILKKYRALVTGIVEDDEVVIKQPIGMMNYHGVAKGLYVASPSGKPSLSKVIVLERDTEKHQTLIEVEFQSGRPHQIRIHLAFIGHPLLGDPLYDSCGQLKSFNSEFDDINHAQDGGYQRPVNPVPGDCGYHLHAHQVALAQPITDVAMYVVAPLPSQRIQITLSLARASAGGSTPRSRDISQGLTRRGGCDRSGRRWRCGSERSS